MSTWQQREDVLSDLQAVTEQQAKRAVLFSVDAKAARRKSAANAMLPRVCDTLRAVYGASGPAVKLYDEVGCHTYHPMHDPSANA